MFYLLSHLLICSAFIISDPLINQVQSQVFIREDFSTLENWEVFYFSDNTGANVVGCVDYIKLRTD